jgi:hypothetical protein
MKNQQRDIFVGQQVALWISRYEGQQGTAPNAEQIASARKEYRDEYDTTHAGPVCRIVPMSEIVANHCNLSARAYLAKK